MRKGSIARYLLPFLPHRHNLNLLARKHGTDKYENRFTTAYSLHLAPIRRKPINLLEIGIGGGAKPENGGASLRMWKDYFPKASIHGIDIHDKQCHQSRRIRVFRGDQNDPAFLRSVAAEIGQLDIVIDDGSHVNEHIITSFRTLFPLMPLGAIYVIEDLSTSYWPDYGGDWQDLKNNFTAVAMLKKAIDGLHHNKIPNYLPDSFDTEISSIHVYSGIAFVMKGRNVPHLSSIDIDTLKANKVPPG